jgi:hypothetical protein
VLLQPLRALLDTPAGTDLPDDVRCRLLVALVRETEGVDDARALDASALALALARRVDDVRLRCAALNARCYVALGPDLVAERDALAEEYRAAAAEQRDHLPVAHWLLFLAAAARTDLVAARAHVDAAVALAGSGQLGHLLGALHVFDGALLVLAGRTAEGQARYEAVAAQLAEAGAMNGELMAVIGRFTAGLERADLSGVHRDAQHLHAAMPGALTDAVVLALFDAGCLDEARAAWALRGPVPRNYFWLAMTTLRAHVAVRLGELDTARAAADDLRPWSGRIAGLDSGTLVVGPVDDALAVVAEATGDPAAAAHRSAAAALRSELRRQLDAVGL